jgi:branched-chain amino acid transport system ATP-binding protein
MILQTEGVVKRFGGLVAVNDVSLHVDAGEIVGLIGPNGAGKSTLLNVIAGVYRPEGGSVRLGDTLITGWSPQRICKNGVARTFQISHPFPKMTVLENVQVAATFGAGLSLKDARARAAEMLDFVGFSVSYGTLVANLNTGQLRQLDLARALASRPRLLLLDEAGAGLRSGELSQLQQTVLKVRDSGISVLIVEHLMELIMSLCDRVAVLHYGKKIAEGTPAQIVEDERVRDAYLGERYIL